MNKHLIAAGAALSILGAALPAAAAVSLTSAAVPYTQDFDSLSGTAWTNDLTLSGWSLFNSVGAPLGSIAVNNGASNAGSFYSFGATGSAERALGGVGSNGTYFGGAAPSGAVAGHIALAVTNATGMTLTAATVRFDGEQWRNGGNTTAQDMVLDYGFGASFAAVTWSGPALAWTSPVASATAAVVDGNGAGKVAGLSLAIPGTWAPGQTLWLRWTERNDSGNDHGLAIDNLSLSVTAVPEPGAAALLLAGLGALGLLARRRG